MFIEDLRARFAIIFVVVVLTAIWNVPNFVNINEGRAAKDKWDEIVLGLDIQGGLHLVMGVDTEGVVEESAKRLSSSLQQELKDEGIQVSAVELKNALKGEVVITFANAAEREKAEKFLADTRYAVQLQTLSKEGSQLEMRYLEAYLRDYKKRIVEQSIETIRNRIDEVGVKEPNIAAQGSDRILVQFPGIEDAATAKELINKTARLEFMMVANEMREIGLAEMIAQAERDGKFTFSIDVKDNQDGQDQLDADGNKKLRYSDYVKELNLKLKDKLPKDTLIIFEKPQNARRFTAENKIPYLVTTTTDLGGDDLKDAYVGYNDFGTPEVRLSFNAKGAKKFADLTGANVGKQMAVVLDRVVKTAPSISERIPSGSAVITLGSGGDRDSTMKEAQTISMALRAGALPAALQQMEERTVGPTLGADSIEKAKIAGLVGGVLVLFFMLFYYKVFGLVANIALALNVMMVLAILTSLRATLTLPGVAGIVLTVGMAVDANVIIFERIKEELAKGTGLSLAVKEGFGRALSAILDANITTAAVCVVLMYYGTGPVRGFAVTLIIGIVTSMFTAIFFSRTLFDFMTQRLGYKKLTV